MYPRTRRKKRTESMEVTAGDRDGEEDGEDKDSPLPKAKHTHDRQKDSPKVHSPVAPVSLPPLTVPINDDHHHQPHRSPIVYIAHLLHEAELSDLIQLDWVNQIKFFLNERSHLLSQLDFVRTQFEKQYGSMKHRLEESETENERLTAQNRTATKQLVLYKSLVEAPERPDSTTTGKDYEQLKSAIDAVVKENERLYAELNDFKTSDPVYEQVQLLESTNRNLQRELNQVLSDNNRLKRKMSGDENKLLKARLSQVVNECEQLRTLNKKLVSEIQSRQRSPRSSSPKQSRIHPHPSAKQQQQQLSPISRHSASSPYLLTIVPKNSEENISPLTVQNLRKFETTSGFPVPAPVLSNDITQLHDHVHVLEQKLQQREHELQTLQIEIEKGTSSIMSSIEDLYIASSSVSPSRHSPPAHFALPAMKSQPTIEQLQNELDQLHDKLDELTRENQTLKCRTQEFDTIYEENEYLYAEKSQWNEEIERARVRELVLEQEIRSLKEREKEFLVANESNVNNSNATQLKLKVDWLHQTNNQLELEIVRLREQLDSLNKKCQETKKELIQKDEHYKQLLKAAEDKQQLPQELARLEKIKLNVESQLEKERQVYEKSIATLEEQNEKREQKYSSLYDTILRLQKDYRQKELEYIQQIDDAMKQRDELHKKLIVLQNEFQHIQQENKSLKEEIKSKDEINRDLKLALTSSNNDTQTVYNQLRQLNTDLAELQQKYERDLAERDQQIANFHIEQKRIISNHDGDALKAQQAIVQLQHDNSRHLSEVDAYRRKCDELQSELRDKEHLVQQMQNDLTERSASRVNMSNQISQEHKGRIVKIADLEYALSQEQKRKAELQRTVQELEAELQKARAAAKDSLNKSQELERRVHETDRHFEETVRTHLQETTEPTRRELNSLRAELVTKSDQITNLQHAIEEEKLKRQRLEMKLKRLKEEYINVRKELYSRIEENNTLQHEIVECRFKNDYNLHITNQTLNSLKSPNEKEPAVAVQLYLKERSENQHWQLKCRMYQQKVEQLQKNYELTRDKYKHRLQEEREIFERTKNKYFDHLKNVQRDLQETRHLLEKDADLKLNQELAYQQLIDERRQLLTSMVDKDAKVREMRRENLLLTSKIQLLEDQMENLNDRVDRTLRERNQLRREINSVRFDSNISIETSACSSPSPSAARASNVEPTAWNQAVHHAESFGFFNERLPESTTVT